MVQNGLLESNDSALFDWLGPPQLGQSAEIAQYRHPMALDELHPGQRYILDLGVVALVSVNGQSVGDATI